MQNAHRLTWLIFLGERGSTRCDVGSNLRANTCNGKRTRKTQTSTKAMPVRIRSRILVNFSVIYIIGLGLFLSIKLITLPPYAHFSVRVPEIAIYQQKSIIFHTVQNVYGLGPRYPNRPNFIKRTVMCVNLSAISAQSGPISIFDVYLGKHLVEPSFRDFYTTYYSGCY